jgi:hypothetical protein
MRLALLVCLLAACSTEGGGSDPQTDAGTAADAAPMADARPALPDAPNATVCAAKEPVVQLIYTCDFKWTQCSGTSNANHEINCKIQAAGSLRFSLCDCMVNGTSQMQFTSTTICGLGSWPELEGEANMRCAWNLQ